MLIKDLFLNAALLNRFIMPTIWILSFCYICSVDITPSWGCCGVEDRLHGLSMQGERLEVWFWEKQSCLVFDFGYASILFFLSPKVHGGVEGGSRKEGE